MKILLVIPSRAFGQSPGYTKFPDELLSIAASLEKHGHTVNLVDRNLDSIKPVDFIGYNPDIVGFSVATGPNIADALVQSAEFKSIFPNTKIVWGFRHPSAFPEQTLSEQAIDYVVIGAGEETTAELADQLENGINDPGSIKGLAYKNAQGRVIINEPRPFILNLDELPDPAWHLIDVHRYTDITLNTSRGCPLRCTFCSDAFFYRGAQCELSAERIVSQMERLNREYAINHLFFSGERFALNRTRLKRFCQLVIEKNIKMTWSCPVASGLEDEDVALMAASGCTSVLFEIETGSQRMLDFLNKGNLLEMEQTFWKLVNNKIIPTLFIMYGMPTEKVEDFNESLSLIRRLDNPPYLYMKFVPFPNTKLFDYCVENSLIEPPVTMNNWVTFPLNCATVVNLSEVPPEMMEQAMTAFRKRYATSRIRFMLKHNPSYFKNIVKNPREFSRAIKDLVRYYWNILLDAANGSESWLLKIKNKLKISK
ncbi:MAG: B12-binding domain-containing radical SAM protein [Dehalogenimonas sp.]